MPIRKVKGGYKWGIRYYKPRRNNIIGFNTDFYFLLKYVII